MINKINNELKIILCLLVFSIFYIIFTKDVVIFYLIFLILTIYFLVKQIDEEGEITNIFKKSKKRIIDNKFGDTINKIKKYKKFNKESFKNGMYYSYKFIEIIEKIHTDNEDSKLLYENSESYLQKALNSFNEIGFSIPDTEISQKFGNLCMKLEKEGFYLLNKISRIINDDFEKSPKNHKCRIEIHHMNVNPSNHYIPNMLF